MSPDAPLLVIVTGPPASGKTTIAQELARSLEIPAIHKDDVKEMLGDAIPGEGIEWSKYLGSASYSVIFHMGRVLVESGCDCLLESNFHPDLSLPGLKDLASKCRIIQVVCSADPKVLSRRYLDRSGAGTRHKVHLDRDEARFIELQESFRRDHRLELPGAVYEVDTTSPEPFDVGSLVEEIRPSLSR